MGSNHKTIKPIASIASHSDFVGIQPSFSKLAAADFAAKDPCISCPAVLLATRDTGLATRY